MPTLQSADLWRQSGRYDAYGPEMLRITDRHDREMLYGPTNEEMITAIFRRRGKSYRDLPRTLYHIQWKFRDEVRPRFGVMRGREFLMKDAYSFDLDEAGARNSYYTELLAYLRTFQRLGIRAVPMKAASGPIGGDLSHEFIVLAPTGESEVFYDAAFEELRLGAVRARLWRCGRTRGDVRPGQRYTPRPTRPMTRRAGRRFPKRGRAGPRHRGRPHLLFRHQIFGEHGLHRPGQRRQPGPSAYGQLRHRRVAPGRRDHRGQPRRCRDRLARERRAVPGRADQHARRRRCLRRGRRRSLRPPRRAGVDTLYDDRDERGGAKFATMDVIGLPWQLIVGPRGLEKGVVELKRRRRASEELKRARWRGWR
jgi:prolyl-tRNA synthetase